MQSLVVLLAPGSVGHIANIVKGYAIAIGVAFAIWFVWRWWRTRECEAALARAGQARRTWSRHLDLELRHPDLARPSQRDAPTGGEAVRYRTFVAMLLVAADEILTLEPTDTWRDILAGHLAFHRSYLTSAAFRDEVLPRLSRPVREVVEQVREP